MNIIIVLVLAGAGLVIGTPVIGVAGAGPLASLYGVSIDSPDLLVLMAHRAVLLGLLGAALILAVFVPQWRFPVIIGGLVSVSMFVLLAAVATTRNPQIASAMAIDIILSCAFVVALVATLFLERTRRRAESMRTPG